MEIVNSVRARVGLVKRNPKISEMKMPKHPSKKSWNRPAAIDETVICTSTDDNDRNNNATVSNNNGHSPAEISEHIEMAVFGQSSSAVPFSHRREVRLGVDKKLLKKILKSKVDMEGTEDLELRCTGMTPVAVLNTKRMEQLRSRCPFLKRLALQNIDPCTERRNRKLRVRDLPTDLEHLSIRESVLEPSTFFANIDEYTLRYLRVLDLSRSFFLENGFKASMATWPKLESLKELYLEGSLQGSSASSLGKLLECFPNLEVLDLEGVELNQDALVIIARLLPKLRKLHLGQTGLTDAAMVRLKQSKRSFANLETICLCGTDVRDMGLEDLMEVCPNVRSITCRRSTVSPEKTAALEKSIPGLKIERVEITHIFSVFRDRCCNHYSLKYDRLIRGVIMNY